MLRGDIINARARAGAMVVELQTQIAREKNKTLREILQRQCEEVGELFAAFSKLEEAMGPRREW